MKCEICKAQEASVHLTQVMDGEVRKLHMCEDCARKGGINIENPVSISDLLLGLGKDEPAEETPAAPDRTCPVCHLRQADFRKTGRLGCPECYAAFAAELAPLLRQMHRRDHHVGRTPPNVPGGVPPAEEAASAQEALDRAVAEERFEEAARLRDRLQAIRRRMAGADGPREGRP
jgi:protein arginine kinase activator